MERGFPLRISAVRFRYASQFLLAIALSVFAVASAFSAEVKNDRSTMDGNRVRWDYDLDGEAGKEADVTLTVTVDGKVYQAKDLHLEGDVGKVMPGKGKSIRWNVLQDFPRGMSSKVEWELLAGGASFTEPTTGMEFVFVKGGCYQMGDTLGDGSSDEKPVHEVCVGDFSIGKYEVTQGQWRRVVGGNPSKFKKGDNYPVENVSWDDVQEFIRKLNSQSGKKYRLPTEAEWEYAARSGGKNEKWSGSNDGPGDVGWFDGNSGNSTHLVGQKKPNGLGIFDMTGNVWEWCDDWYSDGYYRNTPRDNPQGPSSGSQRVLRGGSWSNVPGISRTAFRGRWVFPGDRNYFLGFRLVVSSSSHD